MRAAKLESIWEEVREVLALHPLLHAEEFDGKIRISGTYTLLDGQTEVDRFRVEVVISETYPQQAPKVWEVGGRVPKNIDAHVNPADSSCCVMLEDERWRVWPRGKRLIDFFHGPVHSYFTGQAMVLRGGSWPHGEWDHDIFGIVDYYQQHLKGVPLDTVIGLLEAAAEEHPRGYRDCPCGSKRRLWHCHGDAVKALRENLGRDFARARAAYLKTYIDEITQEMLKASREFIVPATRQSVFEAYRRLQAMVKSKERTSKP